MRLTVALVDIGYWDPCGSLECIVDAPRIGRSMLLFLALLALFTLGFTYICMPEVFRAASLLDVDFSIMIVGLSVSGFASLIGLLCTYVGKTPSSLALLHLLSVVDFEALAISLVPSFLMLPACFSAELTSASTYTFIIPVIGFIAGVLLLRHRPSTDRDFLTTCAEACKEFFLYSGGMEGASGYYYFESRLLKPTADLLLSYRWMGVAVIYASAVIMLSLLYSYTTGRANENVLQLVPTIALVGVSRYFGVRSWWRLWVLRLRLARTGRLKVLKPVGDGGLYGRIYRLAARTGPAVRYVVAGICGVILLNTGLSGVKLAPMAAFGILLTSISILKFLKLKRSVEEEAFRILKDRRLRIRILNPLRYREILTVTLSDYMGMRGARSPREAAALLLEDLRIGRIKLEEIEPDTEAQPPNNNSPSPLRMEILRPRDGKVHHA